MRSEAVSLVERNHCWISASSTILRLNKNMYVCMYGNISVLTTSIPSVHWIRTAVLEIISK